MTAVAADTAALADLGPADPARPGRAQGGNRTMPHPFTPDGRALAPPVHVPGPGGPWETVCENLERDGSAVVFATWGEWLTAALSEAGLRALLGRDWQRYRRTEDAAIRYRFVTSRMVMKYTAAAALRTQPALLDLAYKIGGRPYIRGFDQIDVSLSHTDDLIVVGVSRTGRIGVDAESAGRKMSFELLHGHVCTPAEQAELARMSQARQTAELLRLWTLKEAYTKALGQGLRLGFTEFGFGLESGSLIALDGSPASHGEWAFATHPVLGGRYLVSVACHDTGLDTARDTAVHTMLDEGFMGAVEEGLASA
ncbi:4'-phosphopantetheinyl transferase superfamily protein [Streptomyces sp. NPDC006430]|uniref:4'-phosphopantetheinyl transferase family protein n=1 Tax=Streptomyces sp. NPDC006430 TaxID=3154299 RepID=UPI0033B28711